MNKLIFTAIVPTVNFTFSIAAVVLVVGLIFSLAATAKSMSSNEYKFLEKNIEVEFTSAKTRCNSLLGVAIDRCLTEAESIRNVSKTELDAKYKRFVSTQSDPRIAKADSDNLLAMQKCNSKTDSDELICERHAKVARKKELDNANAQMGMTLPKADSQSNKWLSNSSSMPVIDDLTPIFKKSRLI